MAFKHHSEGIKKITEILKNDGVDAVILGGSIAHKTEREDSDIDLMIVIPEEEYQKKLADNKTWYFNKVEAGGREIFVDGKYISLEFIKDVIKKGTETIRFAFHGAYVTYSAIDGLDEMVSIASEFPISTKNENIDRFSAQLKAWEWHCGEALKRSDEYLLRHSVNKLILFAGRLILTHNEILFPYHKWFMTAIKNAPEKPDGFADMCYELLKEPTRENIDKLFHATEKFISGYETREDWPNVFMRDSEYIWREGRQSIDDI